MKANFKREVKRNKNKHNIRREMRENGPLLSRVVDPPGTKGGPRAGNFPGPPKNPFCPGSWLHPGQKAPPIYFLPPSPFPLTLGFSSAPGAAAVPCSPHRASPTSPSAADLTPPPRAPRPPAHPAVACARPRRTCAARRPGPATVAPGRHRRPVPP